MSELSRRDLLKATAATSMLLGLPALAGGPVAGASTADDPLSFFVNLRFGMFLHFNMGTFHDAEWVDPNQDPKSFAPTALDCGQWADAAKAAGMTFGVLTTKHHDGFCLWPSKLTGYTVANSSHRRDVVAEYVTAFRSRGLVPALYFSIWDRTQGVAAGSVGRADLDFVKGQLTELLTRYGDIPALVIDGWSWQMGLREVPYGEIRDHIRSLQPRCAVVCLTGITEPWGTDVVFYEEPKGVWTAPDNTYAACQGQTIAANGWFWHPSTPTTSLMTADDIVHRHLAQLEPRWSTFILNCPPGPSGLLDDNIVARLREAGALWRPNPARPPLPPQPPRLTHPVAPVTATATSGDAAKAIDGYSDYNGGAQQTLWQPTAALPQSVTLDLGTVRPGIDMLTYLPRQDEVNGEYVTTGDVTGFRVETSTDGVRFAPAARGGWPADKTMKHAKFSPRPARYVRFTATAAVGGRAVASQLDCGRS
ncbi:alpha-L-fucosidase [Amycolatopsis sp. NPDC021455]|uniref:alpha-L-fucosidase n=1 Tax=Amycolatopsis sp. NPDC021455 TaxID=3154901 RepID=UPI0033F0AC24